MKEYKYKINGKDYTVKVGDIDDNIAHVEVNGTAFKVEMEKKTEEKPVIKPVAHPATIAASPVAAAPTAAKSAAEGSGVKSPLPGVVLDVKVNVGDMVKKGDTVLILEAMKMENNINADRDGKVTAVNVKAGDSVLEGTDLIIIG